MKKNKIIMPMVLTVGLLVIQCCWQSVYSQDSNKNQISDTNGLVHEILRVGDGPEAQAGHEVVIHEETKYLDGTILYSTKKTGSPLRFLLGGNQVIEGVDLGVRGMKVGEIRKLIVPPGFE